MKKMNRLDKENIEDILALTPLQEGMLFYYRKDPGSDVYFEQLSLSLTGDINIEIFEQAWNFVIRSNEMLRTVFRWENQENPIQVVLKEHLLKPVYYDVPGEDHDKPGKSLNEIKAGDRIEKFHLNEVPIRVSLCKIGKNRYELIVSNHHILYDGWSTGIILKEFFAAYHDLSNKKELVLPVKTKFREFIKWVQNQDTEKQEKFWTGYLKGFNTPGELSIKRKNKDTTGIGNCCITFPGSVQRELESFVEKYKVTMASVLYIAWGLLLQKYNSSDDVIFGTTVSGRSAKVPGIENMAGLFINTIPLRVQTGPHENPGDLLNRVNITLQKREEYDHTPLVKIKEYSEMGNEEEFFDTIVVIENYPLDSSLVPEDSKFSVDSFSMEEKTHYDLTVGITIFADLKITFSYHQEKFAEDSIQRLANHFRGMVETIIDAPGEEIYEIDILTGEEKNRILCEFNHTKKEYPRDKTIQDMFADQVRKAAPGTALVYRHNWLSYRELNDRTHRLASRLRRKGVTGDTVVGILTERSPAMIIGILGILTAGGAYLPIDPEYPEERIDYMLKDSSAEILLTSQEITDLSSPRASLNLSEGRSFTNDQGPMTNDQIAYILYTSGSTGRPKGVMIDQPSITNLLLALDKEYPFLEWDTYLLKTSYIFDVSVTELFGWIPGRGRVAIIGQNEGKDPHEILKVIERHFITHINFVPSLFKVFIELLNQENIEKLASLKYIFLAGEALLPGLVNQFRRLNGDIILENIYGPTEAAVYASKYSLTHWQDSDYIPIGTPIANVQLYILDRYNHLQPIGVPGELFIGGAGLARGYLNNPESTTDRFISIFNRPYKSYMTYIPKRLYTTGDLARWLPDGNIEFLGRMDYQVKVRGFRIELGEIENWLVKHPGVKEAVVVPHKDTEGEVRLCAYVLGEAGQDELHEYLSGVLPGYMVPAYFEKIAALPLTSSGKIDRKALPAPAIKSMKKYTAPGNEIETALVNTWAEVLKIDQNKIGIDDNFFKLGGHSLNATALVSKIHKKLKFQFQLQQVFEISTIRAQAAHMAKQAENPYVYIEAGEEKEYYDLSYAQRRLWVLCQFEEDSAAYNMPRAQAIAGEFNSSVFIKVARALADRHESLRTIFIQVDGVPRQKIVKDFTFGLETIDLRDLEPEEKEKKAREIFIEDANRSFDLRSGPLFRFTLVRLAEKEYVLIFNIHHIVNDGWSQGTIHNEIIRLYNAFLGESGNKNLLPALLLRYRDYARWHNRCIETGRFDVPGQYWLEKFKDKPNGLELPRDYPRRPVQTFNGARITRGLGTEKTRLLHQICLEQDATLFMCLLTLLDIFLYKYTGQTGIIIGAPIAGRRYAELHPLVGFLVNTLVYRCQLNPDHSCKQLLAAVKEETLNCYRNQDYPFDRLVEELELDRDLSQSPLFNVMLAHNNAETQDISLTMKNAHMSRYVHADDYNMSKFDLIFFMDEIQDQVWLQLEYNSDLFARSTIERMAENFLVMIDNAAGDIHAPVSTLNCLSESEYRRVIHEFNRTSHPFPSLSIQELLEKQVLESKDKTALVYNEDHISYEVLNKQTNRYAHYLKQDQGIIPNRVIGIAMDRSIRMIYVLLGIIKSGGAYLAVDPAYPRERVLHVLADSQAGLLITGMIRPGFFEDYPGQIIEIDRQEEEIMGKSPVNPPPVNRAEDVLYVNYTSGSTGMPNGAMLSHGMLANLIHWQREKSSVDCRLRCLQFTTINFCVSFQEILGTLTSGGQLYLIGEVERQDIDYLMDFLSRHQIENLFLPFSYLNFLFTETSRWHESFKHNLKHIITAGEQLKVTPGLKAFLEQSPWIKLHNHYGSTEMHVVTSFTLDSSTAAQTPIPPAGKPISNTRIYILDDYFNPVPVGVGGEIFAAGTQEFTGYINNSALTGKKLIAHPHLPPGEQKIRLYRTGDLGRWLANGNIEYKGRKDLMVKIRGFRVELGEIETQLLGYEKVKEAAVIVRDETGKDKYLCAYIVGTQEAGTIDSLELREYLAGRLPDYMLPSYFVQLARIPLTPNGKVDKEALPAPAIQEEKDYVAPRDNTEKKLVDIWSGILGMAREKISINDNFFHLGGHSLKATVLVSRISKELGVKIPLTEVFINPYIRRLAAFVKAAGTRRFFSIEAVEKKEYYILSSAQRRLSVLQQMDENGIAYNMPGVWQLQGDLDVEKFAAIFQQLIRRHESLRTSFHMVNDEPVQRIEEEVEVKVEVEEERASRLEGTRGLAPLLKEPATALMSSFIRPFDLSKAPLFRVELLKQEKQKNILTVDMHHIISDGMSIGILVKEFMELYAGKALPVLRLQYKDYSEWQHRQNLEKPIKQQEAYWLREFPGDVPVLELPTDYPRPAVQEFSGSSITFEIDEKETDALKTLANEQRVTLFMLLLSLYTVWLSRLCGQEDIVVGTPIANRRHADLEPLMGMFVNTLALRNFPHGQKLFIQFLQEVKESTVKAFENQDYLYEDLIEKVEVNRETSRNPLFDVMFTLQNLEIPTLEIPGLTLKPRAYETGTSKFDLTLTGFESGQKLLFTFQYSTKLFKQETIQGFVNYFKNIVTAVLAAPGKKIEEIEIITAEERERILIDFNDTVREYPGNKTIQCLFAEQVERTPDNIAAVGPAQVKNRSYMSYMTYISYRELNEISNGLAYLLIEKGVQPDTIAAIMGERSLEMIIGILGTLKAGGAYLPIDPDYPHARIDYMLKDSGVKILLTSQEITALPSPQALYLSEGHHPIFPASLPSNLAYVIYTSGTTGNPKGVMIRHASLVNFVYSMYNDYSRDFSPGDNCLSLTNFCFDVSVCEIFMPLVFGAGIVLLPQDKLFEPEALARTIVRNSITFAYIPPGLLKEVYRQLKLYVPSISLELNKMLVGVEPIPDNVLEDYLSLNPLLQIINGYGPTEATICAAAYRYQSHQPEDKRVPIGGPLANTRILLLDKTNHLSPVGIPGELCITGIGLSRGYLNRPGLTVEKFCLWRQGGRFLKKLPPLTPRKNFLLEAPGKNSMQTCRHADISSSQHSTTPPLTTHHYPHSPYSPLYRTGDLAKWLPEGNIEFLGRKDHQIKIRGYRVELGEIESRLLNHPDIKEAVVPARKDEQGNIYLCAYIVTGKELTVTELREYLAEYLPAYMIPAYFVQIEKIPLNPNGKIDIKALPEPGIKKGEDDEAPQNALEEKLVEIWQEVLGPGTRVGSEDNFFELGGHSLKGTVLISRIHREFNTGLLLVELFKYPTVRSLARYLREKGIGDTDTVEKFTAVQPAAKQEYYALSPAQKQLYVTQQMDAAGTTYNMPLAVRLKGQLENEKLEFIFKSLIARHESFRTSFVPYGKQTVQKIHPEVEFAMEYYQVEVEEERASRLEGTGGLAPLPIDIASNTIKSFIRPFDLSRAPLLRVGLIKLAHTPAALHGRPRQGTHKSQEGNEPEHILMVDMHHIISDGVTLEIFINEFMALSRGETLPQSRLQYKDFSCWRNRLLRSGGLQKQEEFWLERFKGKLPELNMPLDFPRPRTRGSKGETRTIRLDDDLYALLKNNMRRSGTTIYQFLLAVYNVLLYKYTGQTDIIVGSPVSGRRHADLQGIVGVFVNMVAIRNYPGPGKTFAELLEEVKTNTLAAHENQDYPFDELVNRLGLQGKPGRNPVFDVGFLYNALDTQKVQDPHLKITTYEIRHRVSRFDMLMGVWEESGGISLSLEYSTQLFKSSGIDGFLNHYLDILRQVTGNLKIKLADIKIETGLKAIADKKPEINFGF